MYLESCWTLLQVLRGLFFIRTFIVLNIKLCLWAEIILFLPFQFGYILFLFFSLHMVLTRTSCTMLNIIGRNRNRHPQLVFFLSYINSFHLLPGSMILTMCFSKYCFRLFVFRSHLALFRAYSWFRNLFWRRSEV